MKLMMHYILDGHEPVPCDDLITWGKCMDGPRHVGDTRIGDARVSTVFLGLDHQFGDGPPLLFETMVFGGPLADEMQRYATWDEAARGHEAMCRRIKHD